MFGICSAEGGWRGNVVLTTVKCLTVIKRRRSPDWERGERGHPCGKQCCRYQKVGLHGKVTMVVAIISGILWGQDVKILVWFGENALGCP